MTAQEPERPQIPPSPDASRRRQPPGTSGASDYGGQAASGGLEKPATQRGGARGEGNGAAIVALVLASVAIIVAFPAVAVLCVMLGVAAITLGASQGLRDGRKKQSRGVATGGLVSGITAALIGFGILVFGVLGIVSLVS